MNKIGLFSRFLLWCAGADLHTMERVTPSEVNKYKIMGTCVLIPALIAVFSGGYVMYLLSKSMKFAFLFAPFWALIIFTLDRAVVATTEWGKMSWGVLGRIILSTIIALTISEPVILLLFNDAIEEKRLTNIQEKVYDGTERYHENIFNLRQESSNERENVRILEKSYIEEMTAESGTMVRGKGPVAREKETVYMRALEAFNVNESKRDAELEVLQKKIAYTEQKVTETDANGLLGNMMILSQITDENPIAKWSRRIIWFLFFCIELIPILIKLGTKKPGVSDFIVETDNKRFEELYTIISDLDKEMSEMEKTLKSRLRKFETLFDEIKSCLKLKREEYEYIANEVSYAMNLHLERTKEVTEKVECEKVRAELLARLLAIFEDHMNAIKILMEKSERQFAYVGVNPYTI